MSNVNDSSIPEIADKLQQKIWSKGCNQDIKVRFWSQVDGGMTVQFAKNGVAFKVERQLSKEDILLFASSAEAMDAWFADVAQQVILGFQSAQNGAEFIENAESEDD